MICKGPKQSENAQKVKNGLLWFEIAQIVKNAHKWSQAIHNGPKLSEMVCNNSKNLKTVQNG